MGLVIISAYGYISLPVSKRYTVDHDVSLSLGMIPQTNFHKLRGRGWVINICTDVLAESHLFRLGQELKNLANKNVDFGLLLEM